MSVQLFYVTASSREEAEAIVRNLLDERLIACANILGAMTSIYRWEGEVVTEEEVAVILKSTAENGDRVIEKVKELHSYDCPCIVALTVDNGNSEFLNWIDNEVK